MRRISWAACCASALGALCTCGGDPEVVSCRPGSVLLTLDCRIESESVHAFSVAVKRTGGKTTASTRVTGECPGQRKLQIDVADYANTPSVDITVDPPASEFASIHKTVELRAGCTDATIEIPARPSSAFDAGSDSATSVGDASSADSGTGGTSGAPADAAQPEGGASGSAGSHDAAVPDAPTGGMTGGAGGSAGGLAGMAGTAGSTGTGGMGAGGQSGGAGGSAQSGGAGGAAPTRPGWCDDPALRVATTKGIHTSDEIAASKQTLDPANGTVAGAPTGATTNPATGLHWSNGYKTGTYEAAKDGEVALIVLQGGLEQAAPRFRSSLDKMSYLGDIPAAIVVTADFAGTTTPQGMDLKFKDMFADLKAKFPKLSSKPEYHVVSGGSTAGGSAFDFIWQFRDLATKALSGSPALTCFMAASGGSNQGYVDLINASPVAPLRFSASVGECDIMASLEERLAAGCSTCASAGCVDASACAASYVAINKQVDTALNDKGIPAQLIVQKGGGHDVNTWTTTALNDRLRFLFADIVCK